MAPALQPTIYTGTFIHTLPSDRSSSPISSDKKTHPPIANLVVLPDAAVFVNSSGIIEHIDPDFFSPATLAQRGIAAEGQDAAIEKFISLLNEKQTAQGQTWALVNGNERARRNRKGSGGGTRGGSWWFPGFVDTHIHASQYPNAGIFGTSTLLDWLNTYTFPLESSFSSIRVARRIYNRCVSDTLAHGTTTASYYATIHPESTNLLADICMKKGQRAFIGRVCMDSSVNPSYYRDESPEQALEATRATIDYIHHIDPQRSLISPIITPRFAPSCTSALLKGLGNLAASPLLHKPDEPPLPIQTHISENTSECALVASLFPDQKDYASVYDAHGLLTPRTVLAHAVHLSPSERALIKSRGSGVSHCPISNTSLSSGLCPVRTLLDEGVEVGLGTDVSGGFSPSVLVAAREAALVSRTVAALRKNEEDAAVAALATGLSNHRSANIPHTADIGHPLNGSDRKKLLVEECLYLATQGGAQVLGLGDRIGSFEVGKEWDAQLVKIEEVPSYRPDHEDASDDEEDDDRDHGGDDTAGVDEGPVQFWGDISWSDKVAKWVFCGDDRNTEMVFVKGRLVHQRR